MAPKRQAFRRASSKVIFSSLGVLELDGLGLACDALVALVELLALLADEAALLDQAGQHLLGYLRHRLRRQTAKVLGLEGAHIEHAHSVPRPAR